MSLAKWQIALVVPFSAAYFDEANKEVSAELAFMDNDSGKKQHGSYIIVTLEQLELLHLWK